MAGLLKSSPDELSVERASALLRHCLSVDEAKQVRDVAMAMGVYARQQKAGKQSQLDAAEIVLRAEVRMGELSRTIPKASGGSIKTAKVAVSKAKAAEAEGLAPRRARDFQRVAALPPAQLDRYVKESRAAGKAPTSRGALAAVRLEERKEFAARLRAEPPPLPTARHRVIVVDPPWRYDARVEDETHRGRNGYPDMGVEEICALPVRDLAELDSVLWLWTTNAFMREAYVCLDAWGFTPKTILTWDKQKLGLGDWLRNVTEHSILAVRGKPIVTLTNQTTLISESRREHSRKPEAFYGLVEALCPGSKLEMFSREERAGWNAWGAEMNFNQRKERTA